jgi:hypothetical protein
MTSATTDESGTNDIIPADDVGPGADHGSGNALLPEWRASPKGADTWDMQPACTNLLELAGHRTPDTPTQAETGYALGGISQ